MSRIIVHIDLNAFFARCDEIKNPELENKPIAIGKEGRSGIVSTCSYEARKYGVHSAMPTFKAKELCPQLLVIPSDFRFYSYKSQEFLNFIKRYTHLVEQASVDECFADFTEVLKGEKDPIGFFKKLQTDLYNETSLRCSIGVAPTKFLAKMGSDYQKPLGLTVIRRVDIPKMLYPLPIKDFFGIGKRTLPKMKEMGINTIGDFAKRINNDDKELKEILGKFFETAKEWINGYGSDEIDTKPFDPKSIGHSITLPFDTDDFDIISSYIKMLCSEVSERVIQEGKLGTTIQVVVKDTSFQSHNKSITLSNPTNSERTLYEQSLFLFEKNFKGMNIRLVGVTLQNLITLKDLNVQMTLFDYEEHEKESQTKLLINELNRKLTKPMLLRASEVKDNENK